MEGLPEFKREARESVANLMTQVFTHPGDADRSFFRHLEEYPDGHYSVTFDLEYFKDTAEPTKSQWNSLKKKLKRHDNRLFIFKAYKVVGCSGGDTTARCGQLEIGFFAH